MLLQKQLQSFILSRTSILIILFLLEQYQGCQIELDSIRVSIDELQKPFDSIRYRFDSNTIRFDRKTAPAVMKKKWLSENGQISKG
jgi:uncharacterized membrane protein YkgB